MSDTVYEPARKRLRRAVEEDPELRSKPVLICVGTEREKYYVHEHLLRTNSSFFDTALREDWAEGQDRVIEMHATSNEAFNIWIKWLYTGRIFLTQHRVAMVINGITTHKRTWSRWGLVYDMGDFLQDPDFKDAVIDGIIEKMVLYNECPFLLAQWIYDKSPIISAHRKLVVDTFVNCLAAKRMAPEHDPSCSFLC